MPVLLYLSGIRHAARYGSNVLHEFEQRSFALLSELYQRHSPLAKLGPLLLHAFQREAGLATVRHATRNHDHLAWLERVTG